MSRTNTHILAAMSAGALLAAAAVLGATSVLRHDITQISGRASGQSRLGDTAVVMRAGMRPNETIVRKTSHEVWPPLRATYGARGVRMTEERPAADGSEGCRPGTCQDV